MGWPRFSGHFLVTGLSSPKPTHWHSSLTPDTFTRISLSVFSKNLQSSTPSWSYLNPNLALLWGYFLYSSLRQCLFLSCSQSACGEGDGTPLQYSCLKNPMDRGAWWAAVHGVARSWIRLSDFTLFFHFPALEKEMATHSSVLDWRIPGTGEPGGLPSMGSHRVRHDWSDLAAAAAAARVLEVFSLLFIHWLSWSPPEHSPSPSVPTSLASLLPCSWALLPTPFSCCSQLQPSRLLPFMSWIFQYLADAQLYKRIPVIMYDVFNPLGAMNALNSLFSGSSCSY